MAQELRTTNTGRQKDCACSYDLKLWFKCFYREQNGAANIISEIRIVIINGLWFLTWIKKQKLRQNDEPGGRRMLDSSKWLRHLLCVLGKFHKFSEPQFLSLQVGANTIALQLLIYNPQIPKPHTHTKDIFLKKLIWQWNLIDLN